MKPIHARWLLALDLPDERSGWQNDHMHVMFQTEFEAFAVLGSVVDHFGGPKQHGLVRIDQPCPICGRRVQEIIHEPKA